MLQNQSARIGQEHARRECFPRATRSICTTARQRTVFLKQASEELGVQEDVIRRDLGHVLLASWRRCRMQQIKQTLEPKEKEIPIGEEERVAAMKLLRDPRLLDRILADLERCGMVGEETNKLVGYLAATVPACSTRRSRSWCSRQFRSGQIGADGSRARSACPKSNECSTRR